MAALITSSIPPQAFERIRDQIAVILALEMGNQYILNNAYPAISKVCVERFIPINSDTEVPILNVNIERGEYSGQSQVKADGEYWYNIDIYTSAPTDAANGPGDEKAMMVMSKIAGMIRAILSNPEYRLLGFAPGLVIRSTVMRFFVGDKSTVKDALCDVIGRVQLRVEAIETVEDSTSVAILMATTNVRMSTSNEGFYYELIIP